MTGSYRIWLTNSIKRAIRQRRADDRALRRSSRPFDRGAIRHAHGRFQPPLQVERFHTVAIRRLVLTNRRASSV